jgi:hypothetical protein
MNNIDQVAFQFCQSSFRLAQIKVSNILLNNLKPKFFWENLQFPQASTWPTKLLLYYSVPEI